ncbi:MAG: hypoxanthine phosphoribosyltransferase [Candidatus Zixiibacteriota bacterium]
MTDKLKIIIEEKELREKTRELAAEISKDYHDKNPVLVGILKGSFIFMADLTRQLTVPHQIDFISVASYGSSKQGSGVVRWLKDLSINIEGKHVIVVEDIIDSGLTLSYIRDNLLTRNPKSLEIVTLLNKRSRRRRRIPLKYVGFSIPNQFVVGYGLDFDERYRNLAYIAQLKG